MGGKPTCIGRRGKTLALKSALSHAFRGTSYRLVHSPYPHFLSISHGQLVHFPLCLSHFKRTDCETSTGFYFFSPHPFTRCKVIIVFSLCKRLLKHILGFSPFCAALLEESGDPPVQGRSLLHFSLLLSLSHPLEFLAFHT